MNRIRDLVVDPANQSMEEGAIMLARRDSAFGPEAVQRLNRAFQRAWRFVRRSGEADPASDEHSRTSIALHVMAIARTGENSVQRLAKAAIDRFRQQRALEDRRPDSKGG
jgi:hypothetical protein